MEQHAPTWADPGCFYARWSLKRTHGESGNPGNILPLAGANKSVLPPTAWSQYAITSLPTRFVQSCSNRSKSPNLKVVWTPDGRRALVGSMSGEFTLWNGEHFESEMLMQAHETAVRGLRWSHSGEWLLSGDDEGALKIWQPNFNNVNIVPQAHREAIQDIAWSPQNAKFATASDEGCLKVWNFGSMSQESVLTGHGWDVKCVDWHPTLGLLVSGSKDNLVKLWDPRSSNAIATLHGFKNTVSSTRFQPTGGQRLLGASSRDNTGHIVDLRQMATVLVLHGHEADVDTLVWHPIHPQLVTTGTHDGTINHFLIDGQVAEGSATSMLPAWTIPHAHDYAVWDLEWHSGGHILASASNDKSTRFWTRARPDDEDPFNPRFYGESFIPVVNQMTSRSGTAQAPSADQPQPKIPGLDSEVSLSR